MCDPVSIGGAAVMAAGTLMSAKAQADRSKAQNRVLGEANQAQISHMNNATQAFNNTLQKFQPDQQQEALQTIQSDRISQLVNAATGGNTSLPLSGSAPKVVQDTADNSTKVGLDRSHGRAVALAKLAGFGDLFYNNNVAINRSGQNLALEGALAQGDASMVPYNMFQAGKTGQNLETAGKITQAAGSLGSMYGLYKNPAAAAPAVNSGFSGSNYGTY